MKDLKKYKKIIMGILLFIIFFSFSLTITWDSAHYLSYVSIIEGNKLFNTWDIVRGPVFPILIYISNILFGKTSQGFLITQFIFYVLTLYTTNKILYKIIPKKDNKIRKILLFIMLLNPMIFGYFHTMLTEFIAIFLSLISCLLAYEWQKSNVFIKKKKDLLISIFIFVTLPFCYFLKQPYIACVLFPFIISAIINILKFPTLKNILYRFSTIIISIIFLILTIAGWNSFLTLKGIDLNTDRNVKNLLATQIISGATYIEIDNDYNKNQLKNDIYLTQSEKSIGIKNYSKGIKILKIMKNNKVIEKDVIVLTNENISTSTALKIVMKNIFEHPILSINSYSKNLCALSTICKIETKDGVGYYVGKEYDYKNAYENNLIPNRIYTSNQTNLFYLSDELHTYADYYDESNDPGIINYFFKLGIIPTNLIFKISIIITPLVCIIITIAYIKNKKKNNRKILEIGLIFSWFSFMYILSMIFVYAIIDRYVIECFIPNIISYIVLCTCFFKNKRMKGLNENE